MLPFGVFSLHALVKPLPLVQKIRLLPKTLSDKTLSAVPSTRQVARWGQPLLLLPSWVQGGMG